MEKKAKITQTVFKNVWAGPNGNVFYHEVELDNGDKGQIGSKEQMPSKLNPGSELTYTIEGPDARGGYKIKAVNTAVGGGFQGGGGGKKVDPKVQIVGFAMSYTKDLIVAGKVEMWEMEMHFNKIHSLMAGKL